MPDNLYGVKRPTKTKDKQAFSSNALDFSSSLSALISTSATSNATAGRQRASKGKSDIFTAHNKNVKKRAAADSLDDGGQRHKTKDDVGAVDAAMLHKSKRRMEEKARLYQAMKRGEYVDSGEHHGERSLVDFDRKWVEQQGKDQSDSEMTGSDDPDSEVEEIEYVDEFGRSRRGTKRDVKLEERRKKIQENARKELEDSQARPQQPANIIYGDTVQHQAFNPDERIAEKMAAIARKRNQSATPPPDSHYDADAEVRLKGTGFYNFSADAESRRKQMEDLEKQRTETETVRKDRETAMEARKKEIEQRRQLLAEQRSKAEAEKFLNQLDVTQDTP